MSLLLDALRKSEAQRRRGELPRLQTPVASDSVAARGSDRRPRWPWIAALVMLGAVVAVAVVWQAGRSEQPGPSTAVVEPDASAIVDRGVDGGVVRVPGPVVDRIVEDFPEPADSVAMDPPAPEPPVEPRPPAAAESALVERTQSEPASMSPPGGSESTQPVPTAQPAPESAPEPEPAPEQRFIRPWELPPALRARFPELDMTVHFYAPERQDRFVIINGQRYRERGVVAPGVRVNEIVRAGALIEFEGYTVLIE
ncbi:MAG: general secretion pathway protein GspB [Wenzhouxiangellaceae bacterium]|nr:general secretion pathway protein GspB [Wenzhouxiangellaceae bacterium]